MKAKKTSRPAKTSRSKKQSNKLPSFFSKITKFRALLFAGVFAVIGGLALWILQAEAPYVTGKDDILFQHTVEYPHAVNTNSDENPQLIVTRLMGDGTLLCSDGTTKTLKKGKLASAKLSKLYHETIDLGANNIPVGELELIPVTMLQQWETIMIGHRGGTRVISSHDSAGDMRQGFQKIAERLAQECTAATEKIDKKDVKKPKEPKFDREETTVSFMDRYGSMFTPKVSAAQKIPGSFNEPAENEMNYYTNVHRSTHGTASMKASNCLRNAMRSHAQRMANSGEIYHTSSYSSLPAIVNQYCNGGSDAGWQGIGENVGRGGDAAGIFNAYVASPPHHANIDNGTWDYFATGTFVTSTGTHYTGSIFVDCGSNSTCHGKLGTAPAVSTPSSYDNATCTAISAPTSVNAGSSFTARITVKNTGNVSWAMGGSNNKWRLGSSNPRNNTHWGTSRADASGTIAPGASVGFSISAKAPSPTAATTYTFNWEMLKEGSYWLADQPDMPGGDAPSICKLNITVSPTATTPPPTTSDILQSGQRMYPSSGDKYSANGGYFARMQSDGNFVLYKKGGTVAWATYTTGTGAFASMNTDGNFVIYKSDAVNAVYKSNTYSPGAYLKVQDDAKMVVYSKTGGFVWQTTSSNQGTPTYTYPTPSYAYPTPTYSYPTPTYSYPTPTTTTSDRLASGATLSKGGVIYSANRNTRLALQSDGNLVLYYGSSTVRFATYTSTGYRLVMQSDCNLVLYNSSGGAVWWSGTTGRGTGCFMKVQDDGRMAIYNSSGTFLWGRP